MEQSDQKEITPVERRGWAGYTENWKCNSKDYRVRFAEFLLIQEGMKAWEPHVSQFWLPSDLTREEILSIGLQPRHIANVLVFLPFLKYLTDRKDAFYKHEIQFARIHSVILREFILTLGHSTSEFLNILEKNKWIIVNHSYQAGIASKGYRLGDRFKNSRWEKRDWKGSLESFVPEILTNSYIARRKDVLYLLWDRACSYYLSWRDMPDGKAKDICRKTSEMALELIVMRSPSLDTLIPNLAALRVSEGLLNNEPVGTLEDNIKSYENSLQEIEDKRLYVILHDERYPNSTYRLFTNYVNLKKEFRPFIHFRGEELHNVDIQACQAALLATFYSNTLEDQAEKRKFVQLICGQDIYTYLSGSPNNRKAAKTAMFRVMFDRTVNQRGEIYERFAAQFPILNQRIIEHKEPGYKRVAQLMQKTESEIMVFGALHSLLFEYDVPCFSIHDSISGRKQDLPIIKEVIEKSFYERMGFCPKVFLH